MLFSAPIFLFLFLPLALLVVSAGRGRWQDFSLLAFSALFYFWGEPRFFFVALGSAVADYFIANSIYASHGTRKARYFLTLGIVLNIGLLFCYKYLDFFITALNIPLTGLGVAPLGLWRVALPIGLSFIVFEKITYLVDIHRGRGAPAPSLGRYLLYVLLFPKLLAGPIIKYHDIADQLTSRRQSLDDFFIGGRRFLLGLIKKVLIADTLAEIADAVFGMPLHLLGFNQAWIGVLCFTFQIYFDFSAYSDMAIGLARMFGFRLLENFNMPYIAANFTEFWRRWHISLSTWIREYLYFPLGGNRGSTARTYFNLCLCFLLSGLWHGASYTFILWGTYHGVFMVCDKLFWLKVSKRLPRLVNVMLTFVFVMLGWIIFRAKTLPQMGGMIETMLSPGRDGIALYMTSNVWLALGVAAMLSFLPCCGGYEALLNGWRSWRFARLVENWMLGALSLFTLGKAVTVTFNPFLYFRF